MMLTTLRRWFTGRDERFIMPARFHELAAYNTARRDGVVFTPEKVERMASLQADFAAWSASLP